MKTFTSFFVCMTVILFLNSHVFSQEVNLLIILPNNYGTNYYLDRDDFELFGWNITVAGVTETVNPCPVYGGRLGSPQVTVDVLISEIDDITQYDCIAIMSGSGSAGNPCADLLASQEALNLVADAADSGLVVSGFCTGVRVLAAANVINGKNVTGSPGYQSEYEAAGATYINQVTPVIDGNIVTSMMGDCFSFENTEGLARVLEAKNNLLKKAGFERPDESSVSKIFMTGGKVIWSKTFGGSSTEGGRLLCPTHDNGYIVCGYSYSFGAGNCDIYLVKTDADGNEQWSRTYGGTGWDYGYAVCQTSDDGYVITGYTTSQGAGARDVCLVKTDSQGNETWFRSYGGENIDVGRSVCETGDGGFVICGYTRSFGTANQDIYVIRTNSAGDTLWTKVYPECLSEFAHSIIETSDSGFIIAGSAITNISGTFGDRDIYIIKIDSHGNKQWTKALNHFYFDSANSIKQTRDGGYILTGHTDIIYQELLDVYLIKLDDQGNEQWRKQFGESTFYDYGRSVYEMSDGGYLVCGATRSPATENDVYLIKTDSAGNEIYKKILGGVGSDWGSSAIESTDGNIVVTGHTGSYGSGKLDAWLLKVSTLFPDFDAAPTTGHAPLTVSFENKSLGNIKICQWDFNGDGGIDSQEQNPTHSYENPGEYTVKLIISDESFQDTLEQKNYIRVFDGESALSFGGDDSYVKCPTDSSLNLTEKLTLEAWIQPTGWGKVPNIGFGRIIDKKQFALFVIETSPAFNDHSLALQLKHADNKSCISTTPENSIALDTWQHVAVTYDANASDVKMYINGTEQVITQTAAPSGLIADNSIEDLYLGNIANKSNCFEGMIDEVRIWNVIRSAQQIQQKMNCHYIVDRPGLVGCWAMNEGNGDIVSDISDFGNNGNLVDAAWVQGLHLIPTSINETAAVNIPGAFKLYDNYPNPFNPETTIRFDLPQTSEVGLVIYDITGRKIKTIINCKLPSGLHQVSWNGTDDGGKQVASGLYFYKIVAGNFSITKKALLIK